MSPFLTGPLSISTSLSSPAAIAARSSPSADLLSGAAPGPLPSTPIASSLRPRSVALSPPPIPAILPHNARLPSSPPSAPITPSETPHPQNTSLAAPVSIAPVDLPTAATPSAAQIPSARLRCPWEFPSHPATGPPATNSPPTGPLQVFPITAPPIPGQFLFLPQQLRPHRIQMHIIAHRPQISVAAPIHDQRLIPSAEQMPKQLVPPVESSRVSPQKPLHTRHQIGLGGFHHQMKVVGHQTIRMHLPIRLLTGLPQGLQKQHPILVVLEYRFTPIPTIHHMINRPLIFHS